MITRVCKLEDMHNIIFGRDLGGVFEEGALYSVQKIAGEIIFIKIGNHAKIKDFEFKKWSDLMADGNCLLTEKEYEKKINTNDK